MGMQEERFADGSTEVLTQRGVEFTIWQTFTDDGCRRPSRRWYFEICGFRGNATQRNDAIRCAQSTINKQLDATNDAQIVLDGLLRNLRRDCGFVRSSLLTECQGSLAEAREQKLRNMTVERGCTEAEEAIAKQKLSELAKQDYPST